MLQLFNTDFFLLALCAGIALACVCGPLGCFIIWRRMSFFGDTLAHSALLGIALGLATNSDPQLSIVASGLLLAFLLSILEKNSLVSTDTLLGILAHSTLAIGVVFLALTDNIRVNIEAYLFGDMLTISRSNLIWIAAISLAVGLTLYKFWNDFLSITVHAELAEIEGINVQRMRLLLIVLTALTISVALKIVGVLLITSLLIIPPATARRFAETPEKMAFFAVLIGILAVISGLVGAFELDTPVGPTIVVCATFLFALSYLKTGNSTAGRSRS